MTLYRRRKVWWVEYQVNGVRHRQSTHTRKYSVAKAWTTQIDTARKMPTFEEAVTVLKMFYNKPIEGLLPIDSTWDVYIDLAKATGKAAINEYTLYRRKLALKRFLDWIKKERATITTIEAVTGPVSSAFSWKLYMIVCAGSASPNASSSSSVGMNATTSSPSRAMKL